MPSRYRSRQAALQVLYQWDMRAIPVEDALNAFYGSLADEDDQPPPPRDPFAEVLVRGTAARISEIDNLILESSANWRLERMPAVDRNILRMAVYEMTHEGTPAAVVIDQALELARRFSAEESVGFVNGVLDAVRRKREPAGDSEEQGHA